MLDLTLQQVLFRAAAFLAVTSIHGFSLALVARLLGDRGPQYDKRLTLNPLAHLDLLGMVGAILFRLGWIRPMAIDPAELRLGRIGLVICALGSLLLTLAAITALQLLREPILGGMSANVALWGIELVTTIGELGLWFALFNLIPVAPLTGGYILIAIAPETRALQERYRLVVIAVLAVLMVTGVLVDLLRPGTEALAGITGRPRA